MKNNFHFGRFFLGLILVILGLIYLGNSLGIFNVNLHFSWPMFWALVLIFIGLSVLGRAGWFSILIGALAILLVLGILIASLNQNNSKPNPNNTFNVQPESNAKTTQINVTTGAVKLVASGGAISGAIEGDLESNFLTLHTNSKTENGSQIIDLETKSDHLVFGSGENILTLKINQDLPVNLNIKTGAATMDLDFSNVQVKELNIDTGASTLKLNMGNKMEVADVTVKAGASAVSAFLPKELGAKVHLSSALSGKTLIDFNQIDSQNFESKNYASADKKINFDFNLGVSSLKIDWY